MGNRDTLKTVKIQLEVYKKIMSLCKDNTNETGGYLGKTGQTICEFEFDSGIRSENQGIYKINEERLDNVLKKWESDNILLCGILHTHLTGNGKLSQGDIIFIEKFMRYNMSNYKEFYFPIVLPQDKIIFYQAKISNNNAIKIERILYCLKEK